jgi:microcystin-dependent protein
MSSPFVAEIRIFPFNFAPRGWAFCNGQLLSISQNTALFSLLGVNYGGDGRSTFGLPNLQGSVAIHTTQYSGGSPFGDFPLGAIAGESSVTLLNSEMPSHTHTMQGDTSAFDTR